MTGSVNFELDFGMMREMGLRFIGAPFKAIVLEREFFKKWKCLKKEWI